jgi:type II secretory pathway pseudopilin PulG
MERAVSGYTIVEILIVLAISTLLLVSATTLLSGQQGETEFNQTMQDLSSKIQSYIDQVSTGAFPDTTGYNCNISGSRALLSAGGGAQSTNQACLFLGRAIEVVTVGDGKDKIYIYTMLGNRNYWASGADTGQPSVTYEQTNPEPALISTGPGPKTFVLVDDYALGGGAQVVSSRISTSLPSEYDVVGIYTDLSGERPTGSQGATSLVAKAYPISVSSSEVKSDSLRQCLEGTSSCVGGAITNTSEWDLCIQNADNTRRAKLITNFVSTGANLKLDFNDCT